MQSTKVYAASRLTDKDYRRSQHTHKILLGARRGKQRRRQRRNDGARRQTFRESVWRRSVVSWTATPLATQMALDL